MLGLHYTLTTEDYISYYTYVTWESPERKRYRLKYYGKQIVINLVIIAALFYTDVFQFNRTYFYIYAGILVVITGVQLISAKARLNDQGEKFALEPDNQSIFLESLVQMSDAGISIKNDVSETYYRWTAFVKKSENATHYYLFTDSVQAIIIPKRALKTAEDRLQFTKLLSQHLSFDAEVGHLLA